MSFISIKFLLFVIALIVLMYLIKDRKIQNIILLIASYIFYALADWRFLILLIIISILMWFLGLEISKSNGTTARCYLFVAVFIEVFVLLLFKYFDFFAEEFSRVIGWNNNLHKFILPLGISFYIFHSISYVTDVYKRKVLPERNIFNILLYLGFFPQITSGPIVKSYDFLPQLENRVGVNKSNFRIGIQRFALGVFKKKVIADRLGVCVDAVYSAPAAYNSISIIMAVISYSLQIYYDFSGYSDMAIGVGTMLGFNLGENFNLPYIAKNPSDFWKRWHISLSSWFKEYVYIPLGGSRNGKLKTYINLFFTMLLSGVWHGANWGFVLWGILNALISVIHKMFVDLTCRYRVKNSLARKFFTKFAVLFNCTIVTIFWIPFRENNPSKAWYIVKRMFSLEPGMTYIYDYSLIFIVLLLLVQAFAILKNDGNYPIKDLNLDKFVNKIVFLCFIIIIIVFSYTGDTMFIYSHF